jgi:hypothetical protein
MPAFLGGAEARALRGAVNRAARVLSGRSAQTGSFLSRAESAPRSLRAKLGLGEPLLKQASAMGPDDLRAECSHLEAEIARLRPQLVDAERRLRLARERAESVAPRSYWAGILVGSGLLAIIGIAYDCIGLLALGYLQ